jgi:hypothetical protein
MKRNIFDCSTCYIKVAVPTHGVVISRDECRDRLAHEIHERRRKWKHNTAAGIIAVLVIAAAFDFSGITVVVDALDAVAAVVAAMTAVIVIVITGSRSDVVEGRVINIHTRLSPVQSK